MRKPIITEEEKQKIKEMDSTRKKIGYIWDYYKLWIIGAVVLVGLVVYFTVVFATREDKPILDVVLVNNYDDVSEDCRLTQGFVSYVGEENLPGRVTFDNNAFFNLANNSDYKNSYYMKVNLGYEYVQRKEYVIEEGNSSRDFGLGNISNLSVGASYTFLKDLSVFGRVNNLLNKQYYYEYGYPAEKLNVLAGLSLAF